MKQFMPDATSKERLNFLQENAERVEQTTYQKPLSLVTTNAPMNFTLDINIFKGFPPQSLSVEICLDIEEGAAKFWLESVQLNELLQSCVGDIFEVELKAAEGIVIINK